MRPVDADGDPLAARTSAETGHGEDDGRRRGDVACHEELRPRRDGGEKSVFDLLGRFDRAGELDDLRRLGPGPVACSLPDPDDGPVFVVVEEHLVTGPEPDAVGDDVHGRGRVFSEDEVLAGGAEELAEAGASLEIGVGQDADVEVHRLLVEPILPQSLGDPHRLRRRAEGAVVEVGGVGPDSPVASVVVHPESVAAVG